MELVTPLKRQALPAQRAAAFLLLSRLCWVLGPIVGFCLVEVLNYNHPLTSFTPLQVALNLVFYYLIAGLIYLLVGRRNLSCGISTTLFWCIGMANHYVISFRGRTIFPGDLLSLQTAANVSGNYSYAFDATQAATLAALGVFLLLLALLPRQTGRTRLRKRVLLPAAAVAVGFFAMFFCTGFLASTGIEPSMWTTTGNGFVLNFSVCLRYSRVEPPEDYSPELLNSVKASAAEYVPAMGGGGEKTQPVNIIAIMNESFSDLSVLGSFETNQDYLPFWRSLTENTVKGYAYSSVFGGTTANAEFEFLTGSSTAFTPAGTVPYQMYVKEGSASLTAQMKTLGYRCVAAHPYLSNGWNRPTVYGDFGFDEALFLEDFTDVERYRGYVTDRSNYENLIRLYEEKQAGEKLFLFNVTMQNHSGYNVPWTALPREVRLTGTMEGRHPTVDQYLSLIYQSDKAFEFLVDHFSQVEEPTVILMFGDHQPQVAGSFYSKLLGTNPSLRCAQEKYKVPFLLWANYDIEEQDGVETSFNYLSTLLCETAGLPLTGYQRFLAGLRETVPALNANGYLDESGKWHQRAATMPADAQKALRDYQSLQYNELFEGREERLTDFFFLPNQ